MLEKVRYRAIPLTPVHIGTGETAGPEEYFLDNGALVRFRPSEVFARWDDRQRKEYESKIDNGRLDAAFEQVRQSARRMPEAHWYRCETGRSATEKLRNAVARPEQARGEIHLLPRNPYTGRVVVPGSAIKGALRTAALNVLLSGREDLKQKAASALAEARRLENNGKHKEADKELQRMESRLQEELFRGGGKDKLERDPFRFLKVSDAELQAQPRRFTERVDLAVVVYADQEARRQGPPMFVERLKSRADGEAAEFELEIAIDLDCQNHPSTRDPKRVGVPWPVGREWLMQAANYFFLTRFLDEQKRFPRYYPASASASAQAPAGGCLLRLGRYSHFESLSLDGARLGYNRQKKQWITQGSTRTACELAGGGQSVFGWLLLEPLS